MKKINIGVIAAAGKGTRAYPRTSFIPKPLFVFEGKTILHRNVDLLFTKFKVKIIYILVGHLKEQVIAEIERITPFMKGKGVEIIPCNWTTKGLASDVASLREFIKEPFITILGDEFYYKTSHENFLKTFQKHPSLSASIGVQKTDLISKIRKNYSVELAGDKITNLVEKPSNPPNHLLGLGSYFFTPDYFTFFDKTKPSQKSSVIEITDVIDNMAKNSKSGVFATFMNCEYFNINSMQDYHHAVYEVRNDQFKRFKTSIIIPTHNNENSISEVLVDFKNKSNEVLIVDCGSIDQTLKFAKKEKVKIFKLPLIQKGLGNQARFGISQSSGELLIFVSPDGTFRSKDLPKLLEYMKDSDMVIGTRTTRQMIEQGSNLKTIPRLIHLFLGKLVEIFWWNQEPRFTDINCQFFAIWKESYLKIQEELTEKDHHFVAELMIELVRSHMRVIEIPVSYYKQVEEFEFSNKDFLKDSIQMIVLIFKKKFKIKGR